MYIIDIVLENKYLSLPQYFPNQDSSQGDNIIYKVFLKINIEHLEITFL